VKVLVVIPVYNHAATVRAVAEAALREGHEVLVVDDGSTDGSLDRLAGLGIQRLRGPRNRGKGDAILRAAVLAGASYDAILTLDADGQHDPADARLLLEAARDTWPAILVGERRMDAGNSPRASRFGRAFSNFWVRLECGQSLADSQSGYRLYPVPFLLSWHFFTRGFCFEIEALVRAAWAGLPLVSVPVSVYYPPGDERVSHFHKFRDNLRLTCLHTALVVRSLLPWPHRRLLPRPPRAAFTLGGFLRRLSREHASPGELAAAVGLGIFLGALPIIPFGLAVIVYVNRKLHLNQLAGAAASNLCIAPFVPFLCIQAGHLLLHGRLWTEFNRTTLLHQVHLRAWEWPGRS
jgi:glycosyltransferase involved in cell wall biosynthesis